MIGHDLWPKLLGADNAHRALPGFHLALLPLLIFPATYALPAATRLAWDALKAPRDDGAHAAHRFLLAWAAPSFLFFELLPTKLAHYTLPVYPAIALLCGAGLYAMRGKRWRTAHPVGLVAFAVTAAALVALLSTTAIFMPGDFAADLRRAISTALISVAIVAGAFTALVMLRRPAARAAALIFCALMISFSLRERLLPEARALFVSNEAVAVLTRARLTPSAEHPLWVVGYDEMSIVFLTRTATRLTRAHEAGAQAKPGQVLIVEGRALHDIGAELAARNLVFTQAEPPVHGFSLGAGHRVALYVGQVETAPQAINAVRPQNP
jgi:4-amino-4-deoxy-L-arabinose transferase-like glycosyltransferase